MIANGRFKTEGSSCCSTASSVVEVVVLLQTREGGGGRMMENVSEFHAAKILQSRIPRMAE